MDKEKNSFIFTPQQSFACLHLFIMQNSQSSFLQTKKTPISFNLFSQLTHARPLLFHIAVPTSCLQFLVIFQTVFTFPSAPSW